MDQVKVERSLPHTISATATPKPKKPKRRTTTWGFRSKQSWFCFWCNARFYSKAQHLKSAPLQENRQGHSTDEELDKMEADLSSGVMDEAYNAFLGASKFNNAEDSDDSDDDPNSYVETSFQLVEDFLIPQLDRCAARVFIDLGSGTGHILSQVALKRPELMQIRGFEKDEVLLSLAEDWRNRLKGFIGLDSYTIEEEDLESAALENIIDPYGIHGVRKFVYCNNIHFPQSLSYNLARALFPTLPDGSIFMTVKPLGTINELEGLLRPFECEVAEVPKSYKGMFDSLKREDRRFFIYTML